MNNEPKFDEYLDFVFIKTRPVKSPSRGTPLSAGIDFYVPDDFPVTKVKPGCDVRIPSGIKAKFPTDCAMIAFNKSGMALKNKFQVGACVIDADYQGEWNLHFFNVAKPLPLWKQLINSIAPGTFKDNTVTIAPGMKVAQFVCVKTDYLNLKEFEYESDIFQSVTERGSGAFGSTGTT